VPPLAAPASWGRKASGLWAAPRPPEATSSCPDPSGSV
jgi:hypothetical protein